MSTTVHKAINSELACFEKGSVEKIVVQDRMQTGYEYLLTEPSGLNFHPVFRPDLSPPQLLKMGVFGGKYMTDCRDEFPAEWFDEAKLSPVRADSSLNFFGVRASKPLSYWMEKGWIWPDDPRGWFQWYCRYYQGRRCEDDARQIGRWKAMKMPVRARSSASSSSMFSPFSSIRPRVTS